MSATRAPAVVNHQSPLGRWTQVVRCPHHSLASFVRSLEGFDETTPGRVRRVEPAAAEAVLIFGIGQPVFVGADRAGGGEEMSSFFVPLRSRPLRVESTGSQAGVQVNLTPLGARTLLGAPLSEVAAATEMSDLFAGELANLPEELGGARSWPARLDLVERVLGSRIESARTVAAPLAESWRCLANGQVSVSDVADAVGWSRQHLHRQCRREFGHGPQTLARLLRFRRAITLLDRLPLGDVAAVCGYTDQAHLTREFRTFAGSSPRRLLAAHLPDSGGIADVTSVQDEDASSGAE
ncbi:helix-turn-helix domain-containing protein [Nocardia sp. NPDC055053]